MRMMTRRITLHVVTAIVAITVNFFLPRLMPGNPALAVLGRVQAQESKQAIAALELQYGVQTRTGLWGQYVQYWSHLLHGNLGTSQTAEVKLAVPARAFARYDETASAWVWPPGEFAVRIGRSSADLRLSVRVKSLFSRTELGSPGRVNARSTRNACPISNFRSLPY